MVVDLSAQQLFAELHQLAPDQVPSLPTSLGDKTIKVTVSSPEIELMQQAVLDSRKAVALSPQEPFMIYMKVSCLAGLVLASPWVFYQVWQFIAAGLYMHERKYMYGFGALSLFLFGVRNNCLQSFFIIGYIVRKIHYVHIMKTIVRQ